ncbi:DNA-primase RepB domain-containing protein [Hydrogenibacillus schlegelii]|uniref:DNA-primase RepB domain-containing protein n=1 Tax=Hydrogenibacillus schlegelii TaxID=1484 RepID=UPI002352E072|nr:DNA-primase RepB domain-containing protein [Hydrogenibacillus schlegelii]
MFDTARTWFTVLARAGAEYFIVRAVPEAGGKVYSARIPAEKAAGEAYLHFLKRLNRDGHHIYARPEGYRFVLVDDVRNVEDLLQYRPSIIVETSPGNHQAWYVLSETPRHREHARAICRGYAVTLGGDPGSAEPDHLGRVAGFRNVKRRHAPEFPVARIVHADAGAVARMDVPPPGGMWISTPPAGDRIVRAVRDLFRRRGWNAPRQGRSFKEPGVDRSARDFAYAALVIERELERHGMIREQAIGRIRARLYERSSKAVQRGDEYVARTIAAAWRFVAGKRARRI